MLIPLKDYRFSFTFDESLSHATQLYIFYHKCNNLPLTSIIDTQQQTNHKLLKFLLYKMRGFSQIISKLFFRFKLYSFLRKLLYRLILLLLKKVYALILIAYTMVNLNLL